MERDENNALLVSNVWESDGGAVAGLLSRTVHGQNGAADASYYYHYDGNGNVVQLTDSSGAEVARYRYDAFGNTLEARGAQAQANPYRFSTKRWESAVGAYDFGFRFYIASQGRFLTRDPFGEGGGINLYRYVSNSPTNAVDPLGLAPNIDWGEVTRGLKDGAIDEIKSLIPPPPWEIPGMLWAAIQQAKDLFERIKEEGFDVCKLKEALGMMGDVGDILNTLWDAYNAYQRGDSYGLGQKMGKLMAKGVIAAAGAGIAKGVGGVLKNRGPSKGVGCGNSFAAGTLVLMANGTLKPIESVQVGDEVLAKDEQSGKVEKKRVTTKFEGKSAVLAITLSNGETLLATDDHPLYVEGQGFKNAEEAGVGTSIVTRAGPSIQVVKVEQHEEAVAVFNFSVEDSETFFVGKDALWVHNCPDRSFPGVNKDKQAKHDPTDPRFDPTKSPLDPRDLPDGVTVDDVLEDAWNDPVAGNEKTGQTFSESPFPLNPAGDKWLDFRCDKKGTHGWPVPGPPSTVAPPKI